MQMQAGESQAQLACVKAAAAAAAATNAQHDSTVSPLVNYEEIIANHPSVHESEIHSMLCHYTFSLQQKDCARF